MANVYVETKTHPICPECGSQTGIGTIDHLRNEQDFVTRWVCDDCGRSIKIHVVDGTLRSAEVSPAEHWVKGVAVLKLEPQDHPIYFAIEHSDYRPMSAQHESEADRDESRRFLFESHSCPTNWLRPILVVDGADSDPHGLLKYVLWREMDLSDRSSAQDDRVIQIVEEASRG